jgi:hypothetical protein
MAIRITTPKGFKIEVDSITDVDGAVKAAQMLDEQEMTEPSEPDAPVPTSSIGDGGRSTNGKKESVEDENSDQWSNFVSDISDGARAALAYIKEHPGVARVDLAEAVAHGSHNALSGYLRSIAVQTDTIRMKKTLVYTQKEEGHGRDRILHFFPGKLLKERGVRRPGSKEDKETKG